MKKSYFIAGAAMAIALVTVITVSQSVSAYSNKSQDRSLDNHGQFTAEDKAEFVAEKEARREVIKVALEAEDYTAWTAAMDERSPMLEKINDENFPRFVEAHDYMEKARIIFEELDIEKPGKNMGQMRGSMHRFINK